MADKPRSHQDLLRQLPGDIPWGPETVQVLRDFILQTLRLPFTDTVGDPTGVEKPDFVGQVLRDTTTNRFYLAQSPLASSWVRWSGTAPTEATVGLASLAVQELVDGAFVGAVNVSGLNVGETYTYTVDDARFEVRAGILKLEDDQQVDFDTEQTITLTLRVTDSGLRFAEGTFTLEVLENASTGNAPTAVNLGALNVREQTPGFVVGTVLVDDLDPVDNWTYDISDTRFEIVDQQLRLKAGVEVLYATAASITINISATDSFGKTGGPFAHTLTVLQRRAPTDLTLSDNEILSGEAGYGVGIITVSAGETGDTHVLTVDDPRFEVGQTTGQLRLRAAETITTDSAFVSGNMYFDRSQATAEYLHRAAALTSWADAKTFSGAIADVEFMGNDSVLQTIFSDVAGHFKMTRRADNRIEIVGHSVGAVTVTHATELVTSTNGATYTTPAFVPTTGDLIVVSVVSSDSSILPVLTTSTGITFTRVTGSAGQSSVYVADAFAAGVSMTITGDTGTDPTGGMAISVDLISGMSRAGSAAVRQTKSATLGALATPEVVFDAAPLGDNLVWGMVRNATNTTETEPTGFTEVLDDGFTGPDRQIEVVYRNTGHTSATVTWGAASSGTPSAHIVEFDTSSVTPVVKLVSDTSFTADGKQYNIVFGADAGNSLMFLYAAPKGSPLVDSLDPAESSIRDATVNLLNGANFYIGAAVTSAGVISDKLNAKLGKFALNDTMPDLSLSANRDKFFDDEGFVADWTTTEPFGASVTPVLHLHLATAETVTEYAAGETGANGLTVNGTPTAFAPTADQSEVLVRVTATNQFGLTFGKTFTLLVVTSTAGAVPSNIIPQSATIQSSIPFATVSNIEVIDDSGDTHVFLVDDSRFEVVASTAGPPNYTLRLKEGQSVVYATEQSVVLTLTVIDQNQRSAEFEFTVNIAPPGAGRVVTVTSVADFRSALAGAQPGDNIHVRSGTYDLDTGGQLNLATVIGTAALPIKIISIDGRGEALIRGPTTNTSVFGGFKTPAFFGIYNFLIECRSLSGDSSGIKLPGDFGTLQAPHDFVIAGNIIRSNSDGTRSGNDAIKLFEGAYRWVVVGNTLQGNWRESPMDFLSCDDFIVAYNETAAGSVWGFNDNEYAFLYTKAGCNNGLIFRNAMNHSPTKLTYIGGFTGGTAHATAPEARKVLFQCRNITMRLNKFATVAIRGAQQCILEENVIGPHANPVSEAGASGFPAGFNIIRNNYISKTGTGPAIVSVASSTVTGNIETTNLPVIGVGPSFCPVDVLDIEPGDYDSGIPDIE